MNEKKVYLVYPEDEHSHVEDFRFAFETYQEAEAFTKKFKENTKYLITEKTLNPTYITNKDKSPYSVSFTSDDTEPVDFYLEDYEPQIAFAFENKYELSDSRYSEKGYYYFTQYLFAENEEEAIIEARKRLDELIAFGKIGAYVP